MEKVFVSFVSEKPLEGDSPKVRVQSEDPNKEYLVEFIDLDLGQVISVSKINSNLIAISGRQWFFNCLIRVYRDGENIPFFQERFDPRGKTVFIKIDGRALGDNLSWIPYVEEFRKKWDCNVICSTFFNDLFIKIYPEILFVKPNTKIDNIYAQCYIGAHGEINEKYSPIESYRSPLQKVSSSSLNLGWEEIRPKLENLLLNSRPPMSEKYVCISEHASGEKKKWQEAGGWQKVVDFLVSEGYKVVVISKEPTELKNVIDLTGNYSLIDRAYYLYHSKFFIGVSSGLSWLAWSVNTHVLMISDCTPVWHEFNYNMTRVSANPNLENVNYDVINHTKSEEVIRKIKNLL
jgi:hypothetical protein